MKGSNSKRQKCSNEDDRLSDLPTPLISHILSFLPTKYAVRTSTLSTFWRHQWTSITQLCFDDALPPETFSTRRTEASFVNFVDHILLHLTVARPDVFQLNCSQFYGIKQVHSWVSAALSRGIRHIDLSFSLLHSGKMLPSLFSSTNLVVLKLGGLYVDVPMVISLGSLKILHLAVKFPNNDSLSRLVSGCPLLEELKICGNRYNYVHVVKISSITLKRLILIDLRDSGVELLVNTPGLQYIEQVGCCVLENGYSIDLLPCLERAHLDVILYSSQSKRDATIARAMESLLIGISNIKFLYLSIEACQTLEHINPSELPNFPRLIELEMCETRMKLLAAFLHSSPELATLSFRHTFQYTNNQTLHPPSEVPYCVLYKLKHIEVKNFRGQQIELEIVRYFLEKSKCLNKLLIRYHSETTKEKKEEETSKKLLMLPRASSSCIIVIT